MIENRKQAVINKCRHIQLWGYGLWCLTPCSTIFQLYPVLAVGFIGWGNLRARRKPQNCCKPLTNFYHKMFHRHEGDSNSQLLVVIKAQIAQVVVNPTTIWSLTWRLRYIMERTSYIQWNDNAVHFVMDQSA